MKRMFFYFSFILLMSFSVIAQNKEYLVYFEKAKEFENCEPMKAFECLNIASSMMFVYSIADIETSIAIYDMRVKLAKKLDSISDVQFVCSFLNPEQLTFLAIQLNDWSDQHQESSYWQGCQTISLGQRCSFRRHPSAEH